MPNRILKESICTSETLDQLTAEEERFFYRLLVQCDDFGRMDARPQVVRAKCFPLKVDEISDEDVERWLKRLVEVGLINFYEANGKRYLYFRTWESHQRKRARVSKYPQPPKSDDAAFEQELPEEKDIEDLIHALLSSEGKIQGEAIISLERQVRVKESYLDIVIRTSNTCYVLEIKRSRLSNKALKQLMNYLQLVPGYGILVGNGLAANFDLEKCKENNIAVITYTDGFKWDLILDGGFLTEVPWSDVNARDITSHHVKTSDAYIRETRNENTRNENTRNEKRETRNEKPEPPPVVVDDTKSISAIQQALEKAGILCPSPFEMERLFSWVKDGMEIDLVAYACELAALAGKRRVDYINGILRSWARAGVKTRNQAEDAERRRKEGLGSRSPPPKLTEEEARRIQQLNAELETLAAKMGGFDTS